MKKAYFLLVIFSLCCLALLAGCESVLLKENIKAVCTPNPIAEGETAGIEIVYPDTEGTAVVKWTNRKLEIVSGEDVVALAGFTVTGLKAGRAVLRVEAAANCAFGGIVINKTIFSAEIDVEVGSKPLAIES